LLAAIAEYSLSQFACMRRADLECSVFAYRNEAVSHSEFRLCGGWVCTNRIKRKKPITHKGNRLLVVAVVDDLKLCCRADFRSPLLESRLQLS
jgi:hypothetical protein